MTVHHLDDHSYDCWARHDECALRAAGSYLTARIEHDRARLSMYRKAIASGDRGASLVDEEWRKLALDLARDLLAETHKVNWKRERPA